MGSQYGEINKAPRPGLLGKKICSGLSGPFSERGARGGDKGETLSGPLVILSGIPWPLMRKHLIIVIW